MPATLRTDHDFPSFDLQPVLEGQLVRLRGLRETDRSALFAVASDPGIWEQHPTQDRWTPQGFDLFFRESLDSGGALAIIDRSTGGIIGSSRYHGYSTRNSEIEIGWTFLARDYWGGRFNGEAKDLMFAHAFRFVERVVLLVSPSNRRSCRAAEKVGCVVDGERRDSSGTASLCYAVARDRYLAASASPNPNEQ